ncbi:MAG TPA: V-type ATP synthase subunit B, partial [Treponema sp.]|nr:V-type ATP synthase subunit B [Treponema sp.]HRU27425.1 V-type ATP synthase subunit B [Treponema sp.]
MKKVYSKIESITGNVITVRATDVRYGDLAEIDTAFGTSLAEVIRLQN